MEIAAVEAAGRSRFLARLVGVLGEVDAQYVLLHGEVAEDTASDFDLAVDRSSLRAFDTAIRAAALGRLVQAVHYDVPWCVSYVVATGESGRRYRNVDVACDPWGVSRLGPAIPVALGYAAERGGVRVPAPAAAAFFLALKRACEGVKRPSDPAVLAEVFSRDAQGAAELLERWCGAAGAALAERLAARDPDAADGLAAVRAAVAARRRSPRSLARRAAFGAARATARARHPCGLLVCIGGPDGAGKSTLAAALAGESAAFRGSVRLHLSPGLLPPPRVLLGRPPEDGATPHGRPPSGPLGSFARLAYLALDLGLGWAPRIAAPRIRCSLVLLERSSLDVAVDPARYRLRLPSWVLRAFARLAPRPDLVLLLDAPADAIRARKPELRTAEIERQLRAWRTLVPGERLQTIDARAPKERVVGAALDAVDDALAGRLGDLEHCALALRCLGAPASQGTPYVALAAGRRTRWFVPERGAGPLRSGLYRPAGTTRAAGALALEASPRTGLRRRQVRADVTRSLAPVLEDVLGHAPLELAAACPWPDAPGRRAFVSARSGGRVVAYAKVAEDAGPLLRERRMLEALATTAPTSFRAPSVLAMVEWKGAAVLVLEPADTPGSASRPLGHPELIALAELACLGRALAPVLGRADGRVPVHGDFTAANSAAPPRRPLSLWDWEEARLGLPLEDLFHWRAQQFALFGKRTALDLIAGALAPDPQVRTLCRLCGADPTTAPAALAAVLERALGRGLGGGADERRQAALTLLEERGK